MIREIFEDKDDMNLMMMGKTVMTWKLAHKKKWLINFTELEPKIGRCRAILQAKAGTTAAANSAKKRAMKNLWQDAKEAAAR